jgi:MFS family permease
LLLAGSFGLFVGQGGFQVWPVVAFAFASGCLQVFDTPARQALVLDLVPRESAPRALALIALGGRFAAALGAFGAGLLIPLVGVGGCYLVVGGTYAVGAILLATLRVMQAHRGRVIPPFGQALRSAAQLILDVPLVRTLLAAAMTCEMLAFSYAIALPVFAQAVLQAGPEGLGTLNAAAAIGGALAVTLLSLLPLRVPREPVLTTVFLGFGLAMLVLAATRDLLVAAAVVVVIGCCGAAVDVLLQMLIQLAVPEEQRGRAVGVWVLGIGFGPLGDLEMGLVVGAVGAPIGLLLNGALTVAAATTLLVRAKGFRWTSLK